MNKKLTWGKYHFHMKNFSHMKTEPKITTIILYQGRISPCDIYIDETIVILHIYTQKFNFVNTQSYIHTHSGVGETQCISLSRPTTVLEALPVNHTNRCSFLVHQASFWGVICCLQMELQLLDTGYYATTASPQENLKTLDI